MELVRSHLRAAIVSSCVLVTACSSGLPAVPRQSPFAFKHKGEIAAQVEATGTQRDRKLDVRVTVRGKRFVGGVVEVFDDGAPVASAAIEEGGAPLLLGPGNYEIEATTTDGERSAVVGDIAIIAGTCFQENGSPDKPKARYERLFAFEHGGARVRYPNVVRSSPFDEGERQPTERGAATLRVPRFVAYYGVDPDTQIEWIKGGEAQEVTEQRSHLRVTHAWTFSASPESMLSAYLWDTSDYSQSKCSTLFTLVDDDIPIPPSVWKAGGAWTARLTTGGGQTIEVDFEASRARVDYRFAEDAADRSLPLAPRVAPSTTDELAFLAKQEAKAEPKLPTGEAYGNAKPVPVSAAMLRAAYREPAFTAAFHAFAFDRVVANFGSIDRVGSIVHGVQRGETVASIEHAVMVDQANLDADQNEENAYRRAEAAQLRPKLEAWIKKSGGPLQASEFPPLYPSK